MAIRPAPGVSREDLVRVLMAIDGQATQITGPTSPQYFGAYNGWVSGAVAQLRDLVPPSEIDRLLLTRRYWSLQAVSLLGGLDHVRNLVDVEIGERRKAFDDALTELRQWEQRWRQPEWLIVPDTGVFLQHRLQFQDIDWGRLAADPAADGRVVIPLVVIDELDAKKRSGGFVGWRAGYSIGRINALFGTHGNPKYASPRLSASDWSQAAKHSSRGPRGGVRLELQFDAPDHVRLPKADDEIVDQTLALASLAQRPTTLVTFDTRMALRARAAGAKVRHLGDDDLADEVKPKPFVPKPAATQRKGSPPQPPVESG